VDRHVLLSRQSRVSGASRGVLGGNRLDVVARVDRVEGNVLVITEHVSSVVNNSGTVLGATLLESTHAEAGEAGDEGTGGEHAKGKDKDREVLEGLLIGGVAGHSEVAAEVVVHLHNDVLNRFAVGLLVVEVSVNARSAGGVGLEELLVAVAITTEVICGTRLIHARRELFSVTGTALLVVVGKHEGHEGEHEEEGLQHADKKERKGREAERV